MPLYLLKIADKISGPHSITALQEMASVRAFDEAALLALENTEDWKAVRDIPELQGVLFPPRKTISFKATVFESLPQESTEPVTVHEILHANLVSEAKNEPLRPMVKYPNRRRRDFLTCVILCDLVGGAIYRYMPLSHDITVILITFFAILNLGLYWLFYQIMDRY
jgi:hypothetical protein